jgi:hypothetical protein
MDREAGFRSDLPDEGRLAHLARSGDDLDVATPLPNAREQRFEGGTAKGRQSERARLRRFAQHVEQNYSTF